MKLNDRAYWLLVLVGLLLGDFALGRDDGGAFGRAAPKHAVRLEKSVWVPMRDSVRLSTDLYFPEGAGDKLPVVLVRTPYNKNSRRQEGSDARFFAGQGYLVAVQDVRGRFESEGKFLINAAEREDGSDTVSWLAQQSWSNGKIGTFGCSYLGEDQIQLAATRNPNHVAAISQAAGGVNRWAGLITGGAFELAAAFGWFRNNGTKLFLRPPPGAGDDFYARYGEYFNPRPVPGPVDFGSGWRSLPLVEMLQKLGGPPTDFEGFVSHEPADPWYEQLGYVRETDRFDVPVLHVNSWYDYGVADTLDLFNLLQEKSDSTRASRNQFALIPPTVHCRSEAATRSTRVGDRDVGDARLDYWGLYLRWFDYWLKGIQNGVTDTAKVQIYVMGKNEWRAENEWPLERTRYTPYYLHSDGHANSRFGTGVLSTKESNTDAFDRFVYDPQSPVPSVGGPMCCTGTPDAAPGGFDQSEVEARQDVLVYSTRVLEKGVEVTGPIELVLFVSSTASDTDFTGKLVDVHPDGTAYNVQEGILRARYREGFDKKVWIEPNQVHELRVSLHAVSNYFAAGHRIRLEVSSSNFPRFDRNLNTGGNNYDETQSKVAENAIHHSGRYPSRLVLPVIP